MPGIKGEEEEHPAKSNAVRESQFGLRKLVVDK